jgi:hypothetical protein
MTKKFNYFSTVYFQINSGEVRVLLLVAECISVSIFAYRGSYWYEFGYTC